MSEPASRLPARPSLEQLRKQAKDLLQLFRAGDAGAVQRFRDAIPRFAATDPPADAPLADAQFVLAREYGFRSWAELVRHVESIAPTTEIPSNGAPVRPVELARGRSVPVKDGDFASADAVWELYLATRRGDTDRVRTLVAQHPAIALFEYNYTPPIHFAVREGHADLVRFFIERGADVAGYKSYPFQDSLVTIADDHEQHEVGRVLRAHIARSFALREGTAAIIQAAKAGDLARVEAELTRDRALAGASDATGDTALHAAAGAGHVHVVNALLAAGANPNATRGDGKRPIHAVLLHNWREPVSPERVAAVVERLLAAGAEYTIYIAAVRGDMPFVRKALARDDALANFEDTCRFRPLSAAASRNDLEMVKLLLEHGADPNLPEHGARRGHALFTTVYNRRRDIARVLLDHGADPNGMVESGGTPTMLVRKDPELFQLMLAHGGDERPDDESQLERLIDDESAADVERLLQRRPDLIQDERAYWCEGILTGPTSKPSRPMVDLLLRLGARVPTVTKWGAYYYFKHYDMAAYLLGRGVDPNHMNWHRFTVLHHVAAEGDVAKAKLLLDHGAAIDAIDEEYRSTPLGVASRFGRGDVVALLLARGADPNASGAPWSTPLAWARKKGHAEIEAALRAGGASK